MTQRTRIPTSLISALLLAAMAGCGGSGQGETADSGDNAGQPAAGSAPAAEAQPEKSPVCGNCGTVASIDKRRTDGSNTSKGAIAGAVIGAAAGVMAGSSQFSGDEETIAEAVGGAGGAAAGHQIGKRIDAKTYYAVTVNMENGGTQTINVPDASQLSVGQQVRVNNGNIVLQ